MRINGTSSNDKVERIRFVGLSIKYSKIDFSSCLPSSCDGGQVGFLTKATVHTSNVHGVIFDHALRIDQGSYNPEFINGKVNNLGADGIRVGATKGMNFMFSSHDSPICKKKYNLPCFYVEFFRFPLNLQAFLDPKSDQIFSHNVEALLLRAI